MAKVKNPATFSSHFGVSVKKLEKLGVLNPTLAIDTKLFIDPLLLGTSTHVEFRRDARALYRRRFEEIIRFLLATKQPEDIAWRTARKLLEFHEIRGTCLGYGAGSIDGNALGPELTERVLNVAKEIVDLGITDPDLFPAMALFEAAIGPDRISDMTTNVVRRALIAFNRRMLDELGRKGESFDLLGDEGSFLQNPLQRRRTPVILVPSDILRTLPIANDWDEVASAAANNDAIRRRVNEQIGEIWASKAKRDKEKLKSEALSSQEAFQTLLDVIHRVQPNSYDVTADPDGLIKWASVAFQFSSKFPIDLARLHRPTRLQAVHRLVGTIVDQFQFLIEHNGLNKELYRDNGRPRHESSAQRLFFAVAYCYCRANNVDLSPEVDTGTGRVDFKLSAGHNVRVLVEIKLSTNSKLLDGYARQLETYKKSQETMRAYYVAIDVGRMAKKGQELTKLRNDASARGDPLSELIFVDGILKPSASKR
jgi:hypothetical protein